MKKCKWLVRIENASGMAIDPKKYIIEANSKAKAIIKAMMKDKRYWDDEKEALDLWKDREYIDGVYVLGGDTVAVEVNKV